MDARGRPSTRGFSAPWRLVAVAASGGAGTRAGAADAPPLVIDCHAHVYSEDEHAYPTIEKPYRPPAGKGSVSHLRREMTANGVPHATAIQTSTFYGWDNRFLADSSHRHRDVMVGRLHARPRRPVEPRPVDQVCAQFERARLRSIPAKSGRLDDPGVDAFGPPPNGWGS